MSEEMLDSEKVYLAEKERIEKEAAEKEKAARLASAKDAAELEKIKQEMLKEEQQAATDAYLADLEATANREREEYDALLDNLKSKFEEIQKAQDDFSSSLFSDTQKLLTKISIPDGTYTILADTSQQIDTLTEYSDMLDSLIAKRGGLNDYIKDALSGMSVEEGMEFMKAMLNASDEEWDNFSGNFDKRKSLTNKIAETLFPADSVDAAGTLFGDLQQTTQAAVEGIQTEFLDTLVANVKSAIDTAAEKLDAAGATLAEYLNNIIETLNSADFPGISVEGAGGSGGIVNNFTQINNSPKPLDRLTMYRNTKNLLGYAGGGE
jgi:hypothetical protein